MEIKLLPCPVCTTPHFRGVDALRSTLVRVATNIVSCPICGENLLGLDKLTIHLFGHIHLPSKPEVQVQEAIQKEIECLDSPGEPVKCDICTFSFSDQNILDIHQQLLHQTTPDLKTGSYSYHCHLCSKKFKMRGSLMVHLRVAHYGFLRKESQNHSGCPKSAEEIEVKAEQSDNETDKEVKIGEKNGQKNQDNKQWECDVCSKLFTTKYFLKKHKRLHTGEMPYCCNLCNKSFTFQQSYHKHMLYHSSEKPHTCNECGRSFKELSTLQNHARIHSGERPFVCETCGKCFRQRVSYLVHRRIHTGVMPYKCEICDKSFRYKVSQKSHKCQPSSPGNTTHSLEQTNSPLNAPTSPQNIPTSVTSPQNIPIRSQNIPPATLIVPNISHKIQNLPILPRNIPNGALIQNASQLAQIMSQNNLNLSLKNHPATKIVSQSVPSPKSPQKLDQNVSQNKTKCIMNVDLETGHISVVPQTQMGFVEEFEGEDQNVVQKKSIMLNNNELIEVSYNKTDLETQDDFEKLIYADPPTAALSNLLPEVESLYLDGSPSNDINMEKCLEELLQGIN